MPFTKKNTKDYKKQAQRCPICQRPMAKKQDELFETLKMDTAEIERKVENNEITSEQMAKEIKKAYIEEVKKNHPDKGGDPEVFQKATEARDELLKMIGEGKKPSCSTQSCDSAQPRKPTPQDIPHMIKTINNIKKQWKSISEPCPYCHRMIDHRTKKTKVVKKS